MLKGADVFIGVSAPGHSAARAHRSMARDPIVFAMANPTPEIMPDVAAPVRRRSSRTGRSDFPNQVNNLLAFPGIFRGALDVRASRITERMKLAAALRHRRDRRRRRAQSPNTSFPSVFDLARRRRGRQSRRRPRPWTKASRAGDDSLTDTRRREDLDASV